MLRRLIGATVTGCCLIAAGCLWLLLVPTTSAASDPNQDPAPPRPTVAPPPTAVPPPTAAPTTEPTTAPTTGPTAAPTSPPSTGGGGSLRRDVDLMITQTASGDRVAAGDFVEFYITARYIDGERPAEEVVIFEELPAFLTIVQASTTWGTLQTTDNTVRVDIDNLYPDDEVQVYILAQTNTETDPQFVQVIASVDTITEDQTPENDLAFVPVTLMVR